MISLISIRNFRSIAAADISAQWITTLVGANDAGKSNLLRALNLFFNGETNPGEAFDFNRDFNQFAITPQRKAPQIEIRILFNLPEGYRREDIPAEVEWRKVWRREGEVKRMETRKFADGTDFALRSKIPSLMDRIRFSYVPAIKDKAFFADLQGRLYDVLSSVAEEPLKESAGAFQTQLGEQLHDLLDTLRAAFGAEATMRLPDNLRQIFENLEINSGEVPFSRRGDGIKIRHIPMILKFIALTRIETRAPEDVDESMGLMPIVAPYVAQAKKRYDELNEQMRSVRDIAAQRRPTIFVEGESDRQVLTFAWDLFAGVAIDAVNICAGDGAYGSANALQSRALAWLLTLRHRPVPERVRAAAIFDNDSSGKRARASLTDEMKRLNLTGLGLKVVGLPTPTRLRTLAREGFQISVELESFYGDEMWRRAENSGWLEPINDLGELLSSNMVGAMAQGGPNPFQALNDKDALRLKFKFTDAGKSNAARRLARMARPEAEQELAEFRVLITELRNHFNLGQVEQNVA